MGLLDRFKKSAPTDEPAKSAEESEPTADESLGEKQPQRGIFARLKQGLQKTTQLLRTDIRDLFKSEGRLVDDAFLEDLRRISDPDRHGSASGRGDYRGNPHAVPRPRGANGRRSERRQSQAQAADGPGRGAAEIAASGPTVIMVCGVNGSGKTTCIAKLAKHFLAQEKKVVLGAGDTFRAAAVEQLAIWATRLGAEIVKGPSGSDPASVAFAAVKQTIDSAADVCIVDTAGRLQTQQNLMAELTKIHRVIGKQIPDAPHEVLLVLDATTGQNGISQAAALPKR